MDTHVINNARVVELDYTNHRNERKRYKIEPLNIFYGTTDYYPEPTWLMDAFDVERLVFRKFACKRIHSMEPVL